MSLLSGIKSPSRRTDSEFYTRSNRCIADYVVLSIPHLCARWIGKGRHMDLLKDLLRFGHDPSTLLSRDLEQWPSMSSPYWIDEGLTPDPFSVEFIIRCLEVDPGVFDTPAATRVTSEGSDEEFRRFLTTTNPRSLGQRNAFGQTVLHLTIRRPNRLAALLAAGAYPDGPDQNDTTPLMYAVTYGAFAAIHLLVAYGAEIWRRDRLNDRNVIDYALQRQAWEILDLLTHLLESPRGRSRDSCNILDYAIVKNLHSEPWRRYNPKGLRELLRCGANPNLVVECDSTLMHLIVNADEGLLLLEAGFSRLEQQNHWGVTPLMEAVKLPSSILLASLLEKGGKLNHVDEQGRTVLHHMVQGLMQERYPNDNPHSLSPRYNQLSNLSRLFLASDVAQHIARDKTPCSCSDQGQTPLALLISSGFRRLSTHTSSCSSAYIWLLDWYVLLQSSHQHHHLVKAALFDVVWFQRFKESGFDHTCQGISGTDMFHGSQHFGRPRGHSVDDDDSSALKNTLAEQAAISQKVEAWKLSHGSDDAFEWILQISKILKAYNLSFEKPPRTRNKEVSCTDVLTQEMVGLIFFIVSFTSYTIPYQQASRQIRTQGLPSLP